MSRTKHHKGQRHLHCGEDFWSRRCFGSGCMSTGPVSKWITRMKERARTRRLEMLALVDPENVESRFPGE